MERSFIIIEPDPIVSLDVAGTLKSTFPRSDLLIVGSIAEAKRLAISDKNAICAIVTSKAVNDSGLEFLEALVASGGQVIFVGEKAKASFPTTHITVPFTSDMIIAALTNDPSVQPENQLEGRTRKPA